MIRHRSPKFVGGIAKDLKGQVLDPMALQVISQDVRLAFVERGRGGHLIKGGGFHGIVNTRPLPARV